MPREGRIRLVVLFGGVSAEHEVSCVTAAQVLGAIDPDRYDAVPVGITREGRWVRNDEAIVTLAAGHRALPSSLEVAGTDIEPLATVDPATTDGPLVVLPLLHGPHGEDGTVQGLLELAAVPYVGSGVLGSALCMDKAMAKTVAAAAGIPQGQWLAFRAGQSDHDAVAHEVAAQLGLPAFIKPANLGSSVGITKAHDPTELAEAIDVAFSYDERIVAEEAIAGRELEVAVLGNLEPVASVPGEIVPGAEFYDYDDKYLSGAARLVIPAELPEPVSAEIRRLAVKAFEALRAEGMARVDFFYEPDGRGLLLNEVNTIPGFTTASMYPKLWEASGISYPELIDRLVELALDRHRRRSGFSTKR